MKSKNKRGSLALSMNAIVVIILAMAMLGVGLFIVNSVRSKVTTELEGGDLRDPTATATSLHPIVGPGDRLVVQQGKPGNFKFSIHNPTAIEGISVEIISCVGSGGITPTFDPPSFELSAGSTQTFIAQIRADTMLIGEYPCTFQLSNAGGVATEDFVIVVQS